MDDDLAIIDGEKAEVLAKTFVRIHSNGNVSRYRRERREETREQYCNDVGDNYMKTMDVPFTYFELD